MLTAIIVAAGSSRRMGFDKLFAEIAGKPVIAHTVAAFDSANVVTAIVIVAREDRHREIESIVRDQNFKKIHAIVSGGEHRQDSVRAGLDHLPENARHVAVHDAARPLVTPEQIERVYQVAREHGAAALAATVSDTLKRADVDLVVNSSVDRHQLFAMQTPQIFERKMVEEAYRVILADKVAVTDEVSAIERIRGKVVLVPNEQPNFKITYPGDLAMAEFVLNQRAKRR
ncbi:MAG TPA: 2-C-methyl-D-erythritol 4-phosphate cytidylyltransferase [Chthoniobacterales bacterium]|nr:2-C-methyl-D-erythritol 4-phosphate cytidylyltransferase [Chthoniobacterales bacterium]